MLPWIIILAIVGLLLGIVEVLIPGFGVFGILGAIALFVSTILIAMTYGTVAFLITVGALIILFGIIIKILKTKKVYHKFVLSDRLDTQDFDETSIQGLEGKEGLTLTPLKPYGKANIEGRLVDVFSSGEFIEKNKTIQVIQIHGKNVVVQEIK